MTSDTPGTPATEGAAPAKPPRRRATRKAAAPAPVESSEPQSAAADAPQGGAAADSAPQDDAAADSASTDTGLPDTAPTDGPEPAATPPADEQPAPRARRSRRATSATTAPSADVSDPASGSSGDAPKRATRSRATKARPAEVEAPPVLDVLAELGRTRPATGGPLTDSPAPVDVDPDTETVEPDAVAADDVPQGQPEPAEPTQATGSGAVPEGEPATPAAPDEVQDEDVAGPRLATTALLFQPPQPTATRPRRRRVVAPAGPPQFIVPEVISPEPDPEPQPQPAQEPTSAPAASEEPAPQRGRGRRATRTTAAPAPEPGRSTESAQGATDAPARAQGVDAAPADVGMQPDLPDEVAEHDAADSAPTEPARSRRGSRRRGGRASRPGDDATDTAADEESQQTTQDEPRDVEDTDAADVTTDETSDDDSDDTSEGAPRRRRRRGGRGRRSRSGGDAEGAQSSADEADDSDDDEDDEDETSGSDTGDLEADGDDTAGEPGEGDEGAGSSRRRRRRRRSGRGGEAGEAEGDTAAAPRARAARPVSDEVTALRGSTRLEAKRQRRREGRDAGRRRQIITEAEFLARRESVDRTMVVRELDGRTQIAVLEDGVLVEHYVSRQAQVSMAGNVYLGRVQNVLPSMEAAFVDVGKGRNAVLYAGEVNWDAAGLEGQPRRIEQALKSGDSVLVQVTKDPIGHKGARLTAQITLAGRYLVYVPSGGMTGISRKLPDNERARLKKLLREIVPDSAGVIVRTAAEGASEEELRADIQRLQEQWAAIEKKAKTASAPALLQGEPDMAIRVVRDIFNDDFASLVVQGDEAWQTISGYIGALAPDLAQKVTRWTGEGDVFAAHRVDEQLAKGMDRKVWLPSGGSLVIDRTEAMTVVDVNTGKFTGSGGTLEETVTRNNLEAAEEIVRQLRLRDIGGIIVIDFIDMVLELNRDLVLRRLVECLGRDRTKHQVAEVTSLGLVQMTRKRVGQGLVEAFSETCEHCNGRGFIVHTDPIERGGAPVTQTPQPPVGGDDPKRAARRGRRGGKEPATAGVPSGLPMVPVLPEAREAVKATLATIAAAAAHAHEHEHNGHGAGAAGTPDGGTSAPLTELPAETAAALHPHAAAAVNEALAALRMPAPSSDEVASGPGDEPGAHDAVEVAEVLTDGALREDEPAADASAAEDGDAVPAGDADGASGETLELHPVDPEVFDLAHTDGEPADGEPADGEPAGGAEPEDAEPGDAEEHGEHQHEAHEHEHGEPDVGEHGEHEHEAHEHEHGVGEHGEHEHGEHEHGEHHHAEDESHQQ